jgi:hypothetical protein
MTAECSNESDPAMGIPAWSRSGAHATKCELFTFPWGSPRESEIEPESSIKAKLGANVLGVASLEVLGELRYVTWSVEQDVRARRGPICR